MRKVLVLGASGATGRLLVEQLLDRGLKVEVIVRLSSTLPESVKTHENLSLIVANVHELTDSELSLFVADCDAVVSCLGHTMNFKGIYGRPRLLVTETVRRFCYGIQKNDLAKPVKFVLMNTAGNRNRDIPEKVSLGHAVVVALLRLLLPPHVDNEKAADFFRGDIGQNNTAIEWAAVRPDNLIDETKVTEYEVHASPMRDAIFDAGVTSRINVGHFMAELITDEILWNTWKGQMPVIYNKS
jgi:NAD(P)-dependent dehydrogenase (short-subunit alcohol dehydrogenase family)